ncbi:MAG: hypothetical protein PVJ02_18250, partial [Gemmatimonadota bacterium]
VVAVALPERIQVVSVLSGEPVPGVSLHHSPVYLLLAPLCGIMDYLSLLTVRQHLMVLGLSWFLFLLWRARRASRTLVAHPWRTLVREGGMIVAFLACLVAFYGFGILGPRPMARLVVDDPDVVVVDFHSHTESSHDGRSGFSAERNRAWHRDAGFDVAYVTDHDSIRAALEAERRNPSRAGDGTSILAGREIVYRDEHLVVLGSVDPRAWGAAAPDEARCSDFPLLIQTLPEDLSRVPGPDCPDGEGGVRAIELVDGDPRGLDQGVRERARILALADSFHLTLVASSNLHGWGRTASGWSLMRIPGWRDMTPDRLGGRIQEEIREGGPGAVQVVGYRRATRPPTALGAASELLIPLDALTWLSRAERVAWLAWVALAAYLVALRRRSRASV